MVNKKRNEQDTESSDELLLQIKITQHQLSIIKNQFTPSLFDKITT